MNRKKIVIYAALAFFSTLSAAQNINDWHTWVGATVAALIAIRALFSNPQTP